MATLPEGFEVETQNQGLTLPQGFEVEESQVKENPKVKF